ncbi:hypothetical protein BGX20_006734 [Mortierella sp. AD010]|nr:hypothetical protein BGX20_006734 [Mortierella sp. AD010]
MEPKDEVKDFNASGSFSSTLEDNRRSNVPRKFGVSRGETTFRSRPEVAHSDVSSTDQHWRNDSRQVHLERTRKATWEENSAKENKVDLVGDRDYRERHSRQRRRHISYPFSQRPDYSSYSPGQIARYLPSPHRPARQRQDRPHMKTLSSSKKFVQSSGSDVSQSSDSTARCSHIARDRYNERLGHGGPSEDEDDNTVYRQRGNIRTGERESIYSTSVSNNTAAMPVSAQSVRSKPIPEHSTVSTETASSGTAKTMNQTELEQRMKALRASITESSRSTQQTIASKTSPRTKLADQTKAYQPISRDRQGHHAQQFLHMRRELEQSKFESEQLQQWIADMRSSTGVSQERPMRQSDPIYSRRSEMYLQPPPLSNRDIRPRNLNERAQTWKRASQVVMRTHESSESDESYHGDDYYWRPIRTADGYKKRYASHSIDGLSSGAESEYRDPSKRDQMYFPTDGDDSDTLADKPSTQMKEKSTRNPFCIRMPQTRHNDLLTAAHKNAPKTVTHNARDYVADQIGFYTFLNDGYEYWHNVWHREKEDIDPLDWLYH